jgi:hypothetical protein
MRIHPSLAAGILSLLLGNITGTGVNAQESRYLGAQFYNGMPDIIVDARAARADNCERFICGEWNEQANPQVFPFEPHQATERYRLLPADSTEKDLVCIWDLKIVTLPADHGPLQEHIFRGFEICTPEPPVISFAQTNLGPIAVHVFQDQAGALHTTVIPSESSAWKDIVDDENQEQSGIIVYNGLPETIIESYIAHADRCETNVCAEWLPRGETVLPMQPHAVATVLPLSTESEDTGDDCLWDIRVVTQKADGSNAGEYIFKKLDFCTPSVSAVSFEQIETGVAVVQSFKNQQGNVSWIITPATAP